MKKLFSLTTFLLLSLWLKAGQPSSTPVELVVHFDLENAHQTLTLLSGGKIDDSQVSAWLALPGTQALIRKVKADTASAKSALQKAIGGQDMTAVEKRFQFDFIRKRLPDFKTWVEVLEQKEDSIIKHLINRLSVYQSGSGSGPVTLFGLMGGYSSGFAFPADPASFYLGLHFYPGDIAAIMNSSEHELFHILQSRAYDYEPIMTYLTQKDSAYEAPYFLLRHVYLEGSAEWLADGSSQVATSPGLKKEEEHAAVNRYRHESVFYLLERLVLDAYRHPAEMDFGQIYTLLFDWNWNNPAYYAGKVMMQELVKVKGIAYLKTSMQRDPLFFINYYIKLSQQTEGYHFSPAFQSLVTSMIALAKQQPPL